MSDINVHLLPFSIDREGPINTKSYFKVEKEKDHYKTVVLGRKLVGAAVSLTDLSTQAHLFEKDTSDAYDDEEIDEDKLESIPWTKTDTQIKEFILWKKDSAPNAQDPRINAIQNWIDISQVIHNSIPLPPTASSSPSV